MTHERTKDDYDFCIIGAGIIGAAVAFSLKGRGSLLLLERNSTFCSEISANNSGVIHPGFNHPPDSAKAGLCVEGSRLMYEYCRSNGIPHSNCGTYILAFSGEDEESLARLEENAAALSIILERKKPPHDPPQLRASLYAPAGGIVDVRALCESLVLKSRAQLRCNREVKRIEFDGTRWKVTAGEDEIHAAFLVNAAGLDTDTIAEMAGYPHYKIAPCSGEYYEIPGWKAPHLYYPAPHSGPGLGLHLTPTLRNRTLIGPTATFLESKTDTRRFFQEEDFRGAAEKLFPGCTKRGIEIAHRGIRPKLRDYEDFVIRKEERPIIHLFGIESPGLTASLAIGRFVRDLLF